MRVSVQKQRQYFWAVVLTTAILTSGCGWFFEGGGTRAGAPPPSLSLADIPLPEELKVDEGKSEMYESEYYGRLGVLRASGRLSRQELLVYYREAMLHHGWQKEGEFNSGEKSLMVFSKAHRSAAITIEEGWLSADVEINVSAKADEPANETGAKESHDAETVR